MFLKFLPLEIEEDTWRVYYPVIVGIVFHSGHKPVFWDTEDKKKFWQLILKCLKKLIPKEKLNFGLEPLPKPGVRAVLIQKESDILEGLDDKKFEELYIQLKCVYQKTDRDFIICAIDESMKISEYVNVKGYSVNEAIDDSLDSLKRTLLYYDTIDAKKRDLFIHREEYVELNPRVIWNISRMIFNYTEDKIRTKYFRDKMLEKRRAFDKLEKMQERVKGDLDLASELRNNFHKEIKLLQAEWKKFEVLYKERVIILDHPNNNIHFRQSPTKTKDISFHILLECVMSEIQKNTELSRRSICAGISLLFDCTQVKDKPDEDALLKMTCKERGLGILNFYLSDKERSKDELDRMDTSEDLLNSKIQKNKTLLSYCSNESNKFAIKHGTKNLGFSFNPEKFEDMARKLFNKLAMLEFHKKEGHI